MRDFITLSCPSCGHKLQITEDINKFACAACGNEHMVNRNGGIVTLKPVIDGIRKVQVGVDKTASELAIARLDKEINELESNIDFIMEQDDDSDGSQIRRLFVYFGVFLFVIGLVFIFLTPMGDISIIIGAIMDITIVSFFIMYQTKMNAMKKEQRRSNEEDLKQLNKQMDILKSELKAHREIVSNNK